MLRTLVSACRSAMMAMAAVVTCAACQAGPAPEAAAGLRHVAEIPLPGPSARFDY